MTVNGSRIVKEKHAASAFTGEGAKRFGGRWNNPGVAVVYVAGSASLAMLEMLVHIEAPELLKRYALFEVSFDDRLITTVDIKDLPKAGGNLRHRARCKQLVTNGCSIAHLLCCVCRALLFQPSGTICSIRAIPTSRW